MRGHLPGYVPQAKTSDLLDSPTAVHTVDLVMVCAAVVVIVLFAGILARQRHMLRSVGAVPLATQRGQRWLYGIGRYQDGELRWYRALGIGTKPTWVLRQGDVEVLGRRSPRESERGAIPPSAVVVDCRTSERTVSMAISEDAYTAFVSWLESSAPR